MLRRTIAVFVCLSFFAGMLMPITASAGELDPDWGDELTNTIVCDSVQIQREVQALPPAVPCSRPW